MPRTRAAIVLTAAARSGDGRRSGYWLAEAAYPWLTLRRAGWQVVPVSTGDAEPEPGAIDRSDRWQRWFLADDEVRAALAGTRRAEHYSPADFGIVVYAGGAGALRDLATDPGLAAFAGEVAADGGIIAACGHGVAGLLEVREPGGTLLVAGRTLAAPSAAEERALALGAVLPFQLADELERRGARPVSGEPFLPRVVADRGLVTGQNPSSAPQLTSQVISATAGLSPGGGTGAR